MKPVNDDCCKVIMIPMFAAATGKNHVATELGRREFGGKRSPPRFRDSPPILSSHHHLGCPRTSTSPPQHRMWSGRRFWQFPRFNGWRWKSKLMIWSFNHSGANPDAEEFPADSGSSDFTNPRQHKPWNSSNLRMCGCVCVFVCVFVCSVFLCLVCLCRYVVLSVLKIHNSKVCCN